MKNIIIIGFIGLTFNGVSQNITGRKFTNTFPESTSAIIKTLRFLDDSTVVFTTGSMNYPENAMVDTLKYSLHKSSIIFSSETPNDSSLSEELMIIDSLRFEKMKKSKKNRNIQIGNYWYESTNEKRKLYLTKK